jgi:hypothetical protein
MQYDLIRRDARRRNDRLIFDWTSIAAPGRDGRDGRMGVIGMICVTRATLSNFHNCRRRGNAMPQLDDDARAVDAALRGLPLLDRMAGLIASVVDSDHDGAHAVAGNDRGGETDGEVSERS